MAGPAPKKDKARELIKQAHIAWWVMFSLVATGFAVSAVWHYLGLPIPGEPGDSGFGNRLLKMMGPAFLVVLLGIHFIVNQQVRTIYLEKVFRVHVFAWATALSQAFMGQIFFWLFHSFPGLAAMSAMAAVFFLAHPPRTDAWQEWVSQEKKEHRPVPVVGNILDYSKSPLPQRIIGSLVLLLFLLPLGLMGKFGATWIQMLPLALPAVLLALVIVGFQNGVEVDRHAKEVRKWWKLFGYKNQKVWPLAEFDRVALEASLLDRGKFFYVELQGNKTSVRLFATPYEEQAVHKARELAGFLEYPVDTQPVTLEQVIDQK